MRTYLQSLKKYPNVVQEALIHEAPHTMFTEVPGEYSVLTQGIVDLGFENLGLDESRFKEVMLGFSGKGVIIPGTNLKMRAGSSFRGLIEPRGRDDLPVLPDNWMEAVLVIDRETGEIIHAGSLVRADQRGPEKASP